MMNFNITTQQIQTFHDQGYLIIFDRFSRDEINLMHLAADRLKGAALQLPIDHTKETFHDYQGSRIVLSPSGDIKRIVWAGAAESCLLTLGQSPKITHPVAQLLACNEADHLINQLHYKLPKKKTDPGVTFNLHCDLQNRKRFDPNWCQVNPLGFDFVQTFVAIDPNIKENGPLNIIPQSHHYIDQPFPLHLTKKTIELSPGSMLIMHEGLAHESKPNTSTLSRRVLINGFSYPGANHASYPGHGSAQRITLRKNN